MDFLETSQREVCKDLASEAASANDKDFTLVSEEILDLEVRRRVSVSTFGVIESPKDVRTVSPAPNDSSVRGPGCSRI